MARTHLLAATAAAVLIAACGGSSNGSNGSSSTDPSTSPPDPAAVSAAEDAARLSGSAIAGTVTDSATRQPLGGVTIAASVLSTTTAADGTYKLAIAAGTYTVTATKTGYQTARQSVTVQQRRTSTANFSLTAIGCTYTYSDWSACTSSGTQTRTVLSSSPAGCTGTPVTTQSCTYVPPTTSGGSYKVFANNDLGMHCVDYGFEVFSILPPYNVVDAQVVQLSSTGKPVVLGASQVSVRYSAIADATGSINSTSKNKSNFWTYALQLYGASLAPGQGLMGMWMPADAPSAAGTTLPWDSTMGLFVAPGVPILPWDDAGNVNRYPLMRFAAFDTGGNRLAYTDVVLPVSEETSCANCHATGKIAASGSGITWSTDTNLEAQARRNVILLHNARNGTNLQPPVLCANCHYSPALDLTGAGATPTQQALPTMSSAMHAFHADKMGTLSDAPVPVGGTPPAPTAQSCYQCHPGASTQCLRGAMTTAVDCQNCHGNMAAVGGKYPLLTDGSIDGTNDGKPRRPWLDVPRCQSCHAGDAVVKTVVTNPPPLAPDGIRFYDAFRTNDPSASPILATNTRFAEQPDLRYRKSKGHGGLACEACHGSTHAIWSAGPNDNVAATQLQGHAGTIGECSTCHQAAPSNGLGGPHGMHPVGSAWVSAHPNMVSSLGLPSCQACHGTDYKGTVLSRMFSTRTLAGKTLTAGTVIGCYTCHNGPNP